MKDKKQQQGLITWPYPTTDHAQWLMLKPLIRTLLLRSTEDTKHKQ